MKIPIVNQRTDYDCGVAVCTSLSLLDSTASEESLYKSFTDLLAPNTLEGTDIRDLLEVIRLRHTEAFYIENMSHTVLDLCTNNGIPVVLLIQGSGSTDKDREYEGYNDGHYVVVCGWFYDDSGVQYIVMDPTCADYVIVSRLNLMRRWHGLDDLNEHRVGQAIVLY
jgi:hypothetical protein